MPHAYFFCGALPTVHLSILKVKEPEGDDRAKAGLKGPGRSATIRMGSWMDMHGSPWRGLTKNV